MRVCVRTYAFTCECVCAVHLRAGIGTPRKKNGKNMQKPLVPFVNFYAFLKKKRYFRFSRFLCTVHTDTTPCVITWYTYIIYTHSNITCCFFFFFIITFFFLFFASIANNHRRRRLFRYRIYRADDRLIIVIIFVSSLDSRTQTALRTARITTSTEHRNREQQHLVSPWLLIKN